ncbi:hypothetical protein [Streptomyces griseoloalbus]|uniref:Uncharacterized protein n=1 Tax=Streptomyces griseoloalbus TaxID=67303 RepID=A0A7W8FAA1_9ACTN|nr:hypothetical protein [Streptomyces albaduncus]MBB5129018.1 hypothetical protein [Streptomyces albaduncus]GGW51242.1 hypothetical protein GCM10010340_32040 [Streptomyces albaduncus]
MSTEARRAPLPPRPTVPPRPAHPPHPAAAGTADRDRHEPAPSPADAAVPRGRTSGGSGAFDVREPVTPPTGDTDRAATGPVDRAPGPRGLTSGGSGTFGGRASADLPAGSGEPGPGGGTGAASAACEGAAGTSLPGPRSSRSGGDATPPPPPRASARFPDTPPTVGRGMPSPDAPPAVPPQPAHRPTARGTGAPPATSRTPETPSETTTRLRAVPADPAARPGEPSPVPPVPPGRPTPGPRGADPAYAPPGPPDPALSWSAPMTPGRTPAPGRRPVVTFGEPEGYDAEARPRPLGRRSRSQVVAAAACLVLGTGLISGAVVGSRLAGDSDGTVARGGFAAAGDMWHNVPVDQLFPPTVRGRGAGPGDADRSWTRIAVAPDSGCDGAFDPLLRKALAPVGCERLLRASYTDATQSHVTTVGLLFTKADAAGMASLARRFDRERLDRRTDLMPLPYAAKGTAAAGFGAEQRASWVISVLTDAPVVVYAVSGWADGRAAGTPQPAEDAMESGATTAPAQAGLGHEAQGLADRVERGLRKKAGTATERPS